MVAGYCVIDCSAAVQNLPLAAHGYPAKQPPQEDRYRVDGIHRNGW
jgi:hypothetical protein